MDAYSVMHEKEIEYHNTQFSLVQNLYIFISNYTYMYIGLPGTPEQFSELASFG